MLSVFHNKALCISSANWDLQAPADSNHHKWALPSISPAGHKIKTQTLKQDSFYNDFLFLKLKCSCIISLFPSFLQPLPCTPLLSLKFMMLLCPPHKCTYVCIPKYVTTACTVCTVLLVCMWSQGADRLVLGKQLEGSFLNKTISPSPYFLVGEIQFLMGAYHLSIIEKQKKMKKRQKQKTLSIASWNLLQGTGSLEKGQNWHEAINQRGKALSVEVDWGTLESPATLGVQIL